MTIEWLEGKKNLLLVTHVAPDGDAIGSVSGLAWLLQELGIRATPYVQEMPDDYAPFAHPDTVIGGSLDMSKFDGMICLDCANTPRLFLPFGKWEDRPDIPILNIDHHASNDRYGDVNEVWSASAATCELIVQIFIGFDMEHLVDSRSATALYMGLLTDTGGFKFSNVGEESYIAASFLVANGAMHDRVVESLYFSKPRNQIKFESQMMTNAAFFYEGQLVFGLIMESDLEKFGIKSSQMEESTQRLREIQGVRVAIRLMEKEDSVRVSLRSKDKKIDVAEIASKFGGGGHKMAAGAVIEGTMTEAMEQLTEAFQCIL